MTAEKMQIKLHLVPEKFLPEGRITEIRKQRSLRQTSFSNEMCYNCLSKIIQKK